MGSAPCCFKGIRRIREQRLGNGLKDIVVVDKFAVLLDSLISKKEVMMIVLIQALRIVRTNNTVVSMNIL